MAVAAGEKFDRDRMAAFYAERHRKTDEGVVEVYHPLGGAPPREIRLLEVNRRVPETTGLEPVDFGVDTDGPDAHVLMVLDVTPKQWEAIRKGRVQLPTGWTLDGAESLPPARKRR